MSGARLGKDDRVLVTGGAGFIGSAVVRALLEQTDARVVVADKLTYAGNAESLEDVAGDPRYHFEQVDICDRAAVRSLFDAHRPTAVLHLAAESHVDRSIDGPDDFIRTNLLGTFTLLEETRRHLAGVGSREHCRFVHVSTDEVFGSLGPEGRFNEASPYRPNSPYAASKAGSDHLARVWHHTYGLPVIVTSCSNNYGPRQFPEKLIPHMIIRGLAGLELPVYGEGTNVRDWVHVEDHARALLAVVERGSVGATYLIGARDERRNLDVVRAVCRILDELSPDVSLGSRESLIRFVDDRPGHDLRYAIDPSRVEREVGWSARRTFEEGLRATVRWYLDNRGWWERILSGEYSAQRLGLGGALRP
jgi:dTDP-glucose 4,6-dehydratase